MRVEFPEVATSVYNCFTYFASLLLCRATLLVFPVYGYKSSAISRKLLANSPAGSHWRTRCRPYARGILELLSH